MINNDETTTMAITFDVAPDHEHWLKAVRRAVAPDDLDLFELCAAQGFHLHPPSVLVNMGEVLAYNPEELNDETRWICAMTLVHERSNHPSTNAFVEFARGVDTHMAALAPPHEHGPYVEIVHRTNGGTWCCPSFTFLDVLCWAMSADPITAIAFEHHPSNRFARITVAGPNHCDVGELHVATDAVRDALARHHYEHVDQGPDASLRHLNAATEAHCHYLLAGTYSHPRYDIWHLEQALGSN